MPNKPRGLGTNAKKHIEEIDALLYSADRALLSLVNKEALNREGVQTVALIASKRISEAQKLIEKLFAMRGDETDIESLIEAAVSKKLDELFVKKNSIDTAISEALDR